ncbi:MAG TPA: hypothetical protein VFV78_03305 [Vicinamibacterales bacterium]|nr:hypothetical protein [Vicinamibacterales bacterium]
MIKTAILGALLIVSTQAAADSPEPVIRALVKAIYAADVAGYNAVTIPDPRRARLTSGGRVNESKLEQLTTDPQSLQMKQVRPFLDHGREAVPDSKGQYAVGTTALFTVTHGGSPMAVALVKLADGWKVDLRWWLAGVEMQSTEPRRGSPEYAIRGLTAALAAMDRTAAATFATPGASLDLLFRGAQREPSGMFDALAMEMPLVELEPGEFFPIRDRIVEGSAQPDMKVFVGQFGVVEIPYVVRRINGDWRVEPQPYYAWFNR